MSVPKCRLCGAGPTSSVTPWGGSVVHACFGPGCVLAGVWFRPDQWRALMAPPVVTDEMVERAWDAATVLGDYRRTFTHGDARAVLEAAMKE